MAWLNEWLPTEVRWLEVVLVDRLDVRLIVGGPVVDVVLVIVVVSPSVGSGSGPNHHHGRRGGPQPRLGLPQNRPGLGKPLPGPGRPGPGNPPNGPGNCAVAETTRERRARNNICMLSTCVVPVKLAGSVLLLVEQASHESRRQCCGTRC